MRRIAALTVVASGLLATIAGQAQSPAPAFEVASVRPNTGASSQSARFGNGSMTFTNYPLRMLISSAYGLRLERVVGGPSWMDSERFDVIARAPAGAPDDQLSLMLRTLLADRFTLVARREMRDQPIYALVVARPDRRLGPNLKLSSKCRKGGVFGGPGATIPPPQAGELMLCGMRSMFTDATGSIIQGGAVSLANLAGALGGSAGRIVVDRTGLTGTYDLDLRFARMGLQAAPAPDSNLPTLFAAIQEQLGLKLESTTGPVEFLVVDGAERPTPD